MELMANNEYQNLQKAIEDFKEYVRDEFKSNRKRVSKLEKELYGLNQRTDHQNGRVSKLEERDDKRAEQLNQIIGRNALKDTGSSMDNGFVRKLVFIIAGLVIVAVILAILSAGGTIEDVRTVL